jgi:hypothetical protein
MLRRSHILTTAALLAVCAAPASAATWEQMNGSDSAAPAPVAEVAPPPSSIAAGTANEYQSLRSPDTGPYVLNRDYGSPDAVDAARDLPPVEITAPVADEPSSGFDWGDAGIGAAGMLALFGITGGLALLLLARKRRHGVRVAH